MYFYFHMGYCESSYSGLDSSTEDLRLNLDSDLNMEMQNNNTVTVILSLDCPATTASEAQPL